jgi:hypothetical protein
MNDLRSEADVRTALRKVFAIAGGVADPTDIVDTSKLYDPRPPKGDLGLAPPPAPAIWFLLAVAVRDLLGTKIAARFGAALLPPELPTFTEFGEVAIALSDRVNRFARRALLAAICEALERDPDEVTPGTKIAHPNEAGGLAFAGRLEAELVRSVCNAPKFAFTETQRATVIAAATIGGLLDDVTDIIKKGCL